MCEVYDFVGYTIKRDLTKMNLNIYQQDRTTNMIQRFNKYVKSLMTFNTQLHQIRALCVVKKKTQNIIQSTEEIKE